VKKQVRHPIFGRPVYCNHCGHFLGYENIIEGAVAFYCRYCKDFVKFISETEEMENNEPDETINQKERR